MLVVIFLFFFFSSFLYWDVLVYVPGGFTISGDGG